MALNYIRMESKTNEEALSDQFSAYEFRRLISILSVYRSQAMPTVHYCMLTDSQLILFAQLGLQFITKNFGQKVQSWSIHVSSYFGNLPVSGHIPILIGF
jgi:hypothetical protein